MVHDGRPAVAAVGALLMLTAGQDPRAYWWSVLPGRLVLVGVGIATMVTPLTSAVLGSVPESEAGVSGQP